MMIEIVLMEDMLASIQRLNAEVGSRCEIEHNLLGTINNLSSRIQTLEQDVVEKDNRITILTEHREQWKRKFEQCVQEANELIEFVNKTFLKEGQQIVLNAETEEYEIVENP